MKQKQILLHVLIVLACSASGFVMADTPVPDKSPVAIIDSKTPSKADLDRLNSENAILTLQLKNAELRSKINAASGSGLSIGGGGAARPRSTSSYIDRSARVKFVSGIGSALTATILLSDGGSTVAKVGTRIPGLGQVSSISTDEVLVANGKEISSIPFVSENQNSSPVNQIAQPAYLPGSAPQVPSISNPLGSY